MIQAENHKKMLEKMKKEHKKELDVVTEEYNKSLTIISKLQNEKELLIAREETIVSFGDLAEERNKATEEEDPIDECIMEEKCVGNCKHIVEEDLRNLKEMRKMKNHGGKRNSPQ